MKFATKNLLACTGAAVFVGSAQAGTITATTVTVESDIVNTGGALVSSANFGEEAVTVNGILHPAGSGGGANLSITPSSGGRFEGDFRNNQTGLGGNLEILFSGIMGATNGVPIGLDISGLTIGTEYLFQAYWEGNNSNRRMAVTAEGDSLTDIADQPTGVLISYNFEATDTVLNFTADITDTASGDKNTWLSGYSLQVVPEPSSLALLGLGGLMIARRRRA